MRKGKFLWLRVFVFVIIVAITATAFTWRAKIEDFVNITILGNSRPAGVVSFDGGLTVHFIDVGQGDAAVVEFPGGEIMLIDAGRWNFTQNKFRSYLSTYIFPNNAPWRFDWIIATHSHADHIGDMAFILNRTGTRVNNIIRPLVFTRAESDSGIPFLQFGLTNYTVHTASGQFGSPATLHHFATAMQSALAFDGSSTNVQLPMRGLTFNVGSGSQQALVTFYSPTQSSYGSGSINRYSTIFCIYFNGRRLMFTGDAYEVNEYRALDLMTGPALPTNVDVLDVGHHGSDTSSSARFINHVRPKYAIIQVGTTQTGNTYNHPDQVVLSRLTNVGATILQTREEGNILVRISADGNAIEVGGIMHYDPWFEYWMLALVVILLSLILLFSVDLIALARRKEEAASR